MGYEYGGLIFWLKKKVRRTFKEVRAAMGTDAEAAALRVFHGRMSLFFLAADETGLSVDNFAAKMYKHALKQLSPDAAFPKTETQDGYKSGTVPEGVIFINIWRNSHEKR
jgi:hypothetical protein